MSLKEWFSGHKIQVFKQHPQMLLKQLGLNNSTVRVLYFWIFLINKMDRGPPHTHLAFGRGERGGSALNCQILWSEDKVGVNIYLFSDLCYITFTSSKKRCSLSFLRACHGQHCSQQVRGKTVAGVTSECHYSEILTHSHCLLIPPSSPCHAYK